MKDLLRAFPERKESAEFDILVPEDDLLGYIWGKTMRFIKRGLVGNISERYVSSFGAGPVSGRFSIVSLLA